MVSRAAKPCSHPGCGVLVQDGTSRCFKHPKLNSFTDKRRGNRHQRGYGAEWTKLRVIILKRDAGICQLCRAAGRIVFANEVDHIIPKAEGGTDEESNLQAICKTCHVKKTQQESKRGIDRVRGSSNL